MINDWSSRTPPDLLHFIPYTWKIDFCLKEFELITTTNEYNWIDCSSQYHENSTIKIVLLVLTPSLAFSLIN